MLHVFANLPVIKQAIGIVNEIKDLCSGSKGPGVNLPVPKKTLIVMSTGEPRSSWWHMGSKGGSDSMQIVTQIRATNITKYNVLIHSARLQRSKTIGQVSTPDPKSNVWGAFPIPPGASTEVHISFYVEKPFAKAKIDFKSHIVLTDQFGNVIDRPIGSIA